MGQHLLPIKAKPFGGNLLDPEVLVLSEFYAHRCLLSVKYVKLKLKFQLYIDKVDGNNNRLGASCFILFYDIFFC